MVAIVTGTGTGVENSSGWVLGSRGQLGNANFGRYGEGVYVNAATGNLSIDRTDEILIGEGPDSVISRNYNSLGSSTDDNGDNWRLSSQRLVTGLTGTVNTTGSTVTRVDWDGSLTVYTWDASRSAYVSASGSGAYDTLTYASNTWTWTDGNSRTAEAYDATNGGRITSSADADGNALTYTYTGSLLTRVTTQDGEHTDLTWSGNNLTQILTTLSGGATVTRTRYTYDGSNRLSTVTTDLSPNDNSVSDGNVVITTYTYDGSSNRVASISQTGGAYLAITYDGSNRVSTLTQTIASGDTSATSFTYHSGYTEITDANSQVTTLHYDGNGQLTEIDLPPAQSGGSSQVITYTYDTNGNLLTATDGSGNTTTYEYDGNGNLTQSLDEAGNKVTYTYSSSNQLLTQTQYLGGSTGNQSPLAINETVSVDGIGDSTTFDPRLNDSDPENDALTISSVSTPSHGTASIVGGGICITYTRTSIGSDSFTYTISDGHGNTATATVTIEEFIGGANQAPEADDDYATVGGTGTITINPLSNDNDADGDTLTIIDPGIPSYGIVSIINGGTAIQYTRTDPGDDYFAYEISDGNGHETYGTIWVSDSGGGSNSAPTATNDAGATPLGVPTTFDPRYNDTDPDNDVLTIISVSTPTHGTATIVNDGTAIRYTHTISGTDSFTYTISDGNGHTSTATITAVVGAGIANLAPAAHNDTVAVFDGGSLTFDPRNNDYDVNLDTLTITSVSTPTYGNATIVNGGTEIEYDRSGSGTDSFTYTISDGNGHTGTATVTVTDPPSVNQPPFANNGNIVVNGIGDSAAFDPRLYDSDPEGDSLTIDWVSSASHGTVSVTGGGTGISYTRTSAGNDSFTYEISDGQGNSRTATVYVTGSTTIVSSAPAPDQVLTTRYVYDSENHLRFVVSPKGEVTEYDYNTAGRQTSAIVYRDNFYDISSLGATDAIAESALSSWASGLSDKSTVERTDTTYDFRGNISTVTSYSTAATNGTGATSQTYTVTTYIYDQYGSLLTRQTSGVANSEVYTYDGLGRLTSSTDLNGATTTFGFTDGSNTSTVTLASGLVQTSVYNDAGELISYQESGSGVSTATATYKYDDLGQLRISADPLGNKTYHLYDHIGRKTADIAADGSLTVYGYDASNRLVSSVTYVNKLNSTQLASLVDGSGNPVNVSLSSILPTANAADEWNWNIYDDANRLIETINGDGDATVFAYDGGSNLVSTTVYANTLSVTGFKTTAPTTLQLPTADSSHDEVTRYFYDNDGRLIATLDSQGHITQTVYNGAGETIETIAYSNAAYSSLLATGRLSQLLATAGTSSQDRHTRYFYDDRGLLRYTLDATLVPTEYVYDNAGNLITTIAYAGSISSTSTYTLSYVQSQISSTLASNSSNRASWAVQDPNTGNLAYAIDANGGVTGYAYNSLGQVVKEVAYATTRTTTSSPSLSTMNSWVSSNSGSADRVTRLVYDQAGRVVYGVDTEGYVTEYRYNLDGQVYLQIRYPSQYSVSDGVTQSSLASLIGSIPSGAEQTSFTYDADGRIASKTVGYGSAEAATASFTYDGAGNLTSVTDARGNTSYSFYDSAGRVVLQIDADGYATATSYTSSGAVASVTHFATAVTGTITPLSPPTITTDSGADAITSFTYDKNNRLTAVTDAGGYSEYYTLDAFGDRVSVTNKLGGLTTNAFDNRGLLVSETLPMNSVRSNGTVEASTVTNTFSYDAFGDRSQMVEASGLTEERTTSYTYDKLGRLTQTTHDAVDVVADDLETVSTITPTETVQYDAFGNVIETTDAAGAHTFSYYDHLGRKIAQVDALGTLSTFVYDANGNVASQKVYGDFVSLPGSPGGTPPSPVNSGNYRETDYTYDHLNRLVTTTVANLQTGYYDTTSGTYVVPSAGDVTLTSYYDKDGNVICQTDGDGNSVWFYYDKNGQKIAEVDQNLYLTTYALDANGNVTTETRYAAALSGAPGVPPSATVPTPTSDSTDRITTFTYDKNGNRLTETRENVVAWSVNTTTGALTLASTSATVTYQYNGLGEVSSKTEATGDATTYVYDHSGRLTSTDGPSFTDYNGSTVQQITDEYYDGLNNLVRTVQEGDGTGANPDRVTTFAYGAGGRLSSTTDGTGFTQNYEYDAAGRVKKTSYERLQSDGTYVTEAQAVRYDALGRAVLQAVATYDGTNWNFGDETQVQYDTFGEVTARGVNGLWQQTYAYDNGGRLWRSNAGDGTVHLHLYDANGKQTLDITSDGNALPGSYDWSTLSIGDAIGLLTNSGANDIGAAAVAGMVVTISAYDARGQQTGTIEPLRQLSRTYNPATNTFGSYTTATITTSQTYDAFGEVTSQTDALGNVTSFTYNTEGKIVRTTHPAVSYTDESGTAHSSVTPIENAYYDLSGRLVGTRDAERYSGSDDASGLINTRVLLAGTGYGGTDALTLTEFHADTGKITNAYNAFGELSKTTNALSGVETMTYDGVGRLATDTHQSGLVDTYIYDGLGQRIRHWNSEFGTSVVETTDYDAQGRVAQTTDFQGYQTTYTYAWSPTLATSGLGTFGGWTKTTYNPAMLNATTHRSETESVDYFGRTVANTDYGSHSYSFTFDLAGRLKTQTLSSTTDTYTYYNTGLLASDVRGTKTGAYQYDKNGNRTVEVYAIGGVTYENETVTWDAMNRMVSLGDPGATGATGYSPVTMNWAYDRDGNIRHMTSSYQLLDVQGNVTGSSSENYWYKYDAMNRFVVTMGTLSGGAIVQGTTGQAITYDLDGNRATTTDSASGVTSYTYNNNDTVASVKIGGVLRAIYGYDAMGRVGGYTEYASDGTTMSYERASGYNYDSQLTMDTVQDVRTDGHWVTMTSYDYVADTNGNGTYGDAGDLYQGGVVTHQLADSYTLPSGLGGGTSDTKNTFTWWDSPVTATAAFKPVWNGSTTYTSTYSYDGLGNLTGVAIADGRPRTVSFIDTLNGQVLQRDEADGNGSTGDPREVHYYFDGMAVGDISNNGTSDVDYAASIAEHIKVPGTGPFRDGATSSTSYANFDQSYDPVNGLTYQGAPTNYTVQAGDTLQSLAYSLWGDASFWYLIADANGLNSGATLIQGQTLSIPNKVHNVHNTSDTYRVYDPNEATGSTSPTTPKPQQKHGGGCGVVGEVIMAVVAVALAVTGVGLLASAAILVATDASIQGVAMLTGMQSSFNWGELAMTAVSSLVGGAIGASGIGGAISGAVGDGVGGAILAGAVTSAASNAITQGIGVATGLQSRFDWAGVAAAGIGGGVTAGVTAEMGGAIKSGDLNFGSAQLNSFAVHGVSSMASVIANAATRSLINGTDFGDNLIAAMPDVIGQTIGNAVAGEIGQSGIQTFIDKDGNTVEYTPSNVPLVPLDDIAMNAQIQPIDIQPVAFNASDLISITPTLTLPSEGVGIPFRFDVGDTTGNRFYDDLQRSVDAVGNVLPSNGFGQTTSGMKITDGGKMAEGIAKAFKVTALMVEGEGDFAYRVSGLAPEGAQIAREGLEETIDRIALPLDIAEGVFTTVGEIENGVRPDLAINGNIIRTGLVMGASTLGASVGPEGAVAAGLFADATLPKGPVIGERLESAGRLGGEALKLDPKLFVLPM